MPNHFERSLKTGQAGEARFCKLVPGTYQAAGTKHDLERANGVTLELKTESRTTAQTPNLAVELASSHGKEGALHNAIKHSDYIVWLFADDKYYVYKPKQLLAYIEQHSELRVVYVNNATYQSKVVLVPRDVVKHLEVELG